MKCIVFLCPNTSDQGKFEGPLCTPCADSLRGQYSPDARWRIIYSVLQDSLGAGVVHT